jgi:hypothetical protein
MLGLASARVVAKIESDTPAVGRTRMTLTTPASQNHPAADHIAAVP